MKYFAIGSFPFQFNLPPSSRRQHPVLYSRKSNRPWGVKRRVSLLSLFAYAAASLYIVLLSRGPFLPQASPAAKLDAIVTVAMCGFHATEMVQSLRTDGGWKGPIYVISDTPMSKTGHDVTLLNVKGNHPKFHTQEQFDDYKAGIHQFKVEIYSKWHKTQIFELIPRDHQVERVLFIDADMMAQRTLSERWLPDIAQVTDDPKCQLSLYPERWYTSLPIIGKNNITLTGKYNSGFMILKRQESRAVLQKWGDLLVRPPFVGRDQGKLTTAIEATNTRVCLLPNRGKHIQNEADVLDRFWFRLFGKGTFLHIASAKMNQERYSHWKDRLQQACNYTNLEYNES